MKMNCISLGSLQLVQQEELANLLINRIYLGHAESFTR
jgi:hypothetical protein